VKLDNLLYNLTSIQLEILGVLGVQKPIHLRNRVAVDDMILNGVKPWIVSKEDEQTHLTSLNSFRLFQNCATPLVVNGQRERIVMDQIQNALKVVTDRMSKRSQLNEEIQNISVSDNTGRGQSYNSKLSKIDKMKKIMQQNINDREIETQRKKDSKESSRNVVIFTGRALVEILRDQTMQKSFMTLAYICDMMVGSEISPL